jgi:hypothetical protein
MTLRKRDGEYRVAHDMRDNEASAYYTNDLADALETGRAMARDTTRLCRPDVPTVHTGVTVVLRRMRSGLSAAECERMGFAQCADGWGCTACKTRAVDPMTHACPVRTVRP